MFGKQSNANIDVPAETGSEDNVPNPTAYYTNGIHSADGNPVATVMDTPYWPNVVEFPGTQAGWWVGMSVESFNGVYNVGQGNPVTFFAANAFGGTNYSNTPIAWIGDTTEPGVSGVGVAGIYFSAWAQGLTSLEATYAGMSPPPYVDRSPHFTAVTDIGSKTICTVYASRADAASADGHFVQPDQFELDSGQSA